MEESGNPGAGLDALDVKATLAHTLEATHLH